MRDHEALSPKGPRRKKTIVLLVCLAALTALFALLSIIISRSDYTRADLAITRFVQSVDAEPLAGAMKLFSWPGYLPQSAFAVGLAALLLFSLCLRWEALATLAATAIEEAMNLAVKTLIHRPRPSASLIHVYITLKSYSFPSGHVMFYTCFFGFLWYLAYMMLKLSAKRTALMVLFSIPILTVGFSRIYLGEHWATDVLGAYILGCIALILSIQLYRWGKNRDFFRSAKTAGKEPL